MFLSITPQILTGITSTAKTILENLGDIEDTWVLINHMEHAQRQYCFDLLLFLMCETCPQSLSDFLVFFRLLEPPTCSTFNDFQSFPNDMFFTLRVIVTSSFCRQSQP